MRYELETIERAVERLEVLCAKAPQRYMLRDRYDHGSCLISEARAELARIASALEELRIAVGDDHHERCRRMFAELGPYQHATAGSPVKATEAWTIPVDGGGS